MTKARATRAQLPAQTNDAAPPPDADTPDPAAGTPPVNPVHDEAGELKPLLMDMGGGIVAPVDPTPYLPTGAYEASTPPGFVSVDATVTTSPPADPPVDPTPPEPRLPPVLASFTRLEVVRGLPEVVGDIETQPVEFAEGTIQRFKASEDDRRTLEVIALPGSGFAVRAVADTNQED